MVINTGDRVRLYSNPRTFRTGVIKNLLPFNQAEVELPDGKVETWDTTKVFHDNN